MGAVAPESLAFLRDIGLLDDATALTPEGSAYFEALFIKREDQASCSILAHALMNCPEAALLSQALAGVRSADRTVAETVLRSQGFGTGLTARSLASLLSLMRRAGLIGYNQRTGAINVLVSPADDPPARTMFVTPRTPYSNKLWLRKALGECEGQISWLDKHFMPVALDTLISAADANRLTSIRILSLLLPEHELASTRRAVADLTLELENRGIAFQWRTIDSRLCRDTHDRWIIADNIAWNVPNANAVFSGQHSEISRSDQRESLAALFETYWSQAVPMSIT